MVSYFKNANKIDDGIIVIDNFLKEDYLIDLVTTLDKIKWDYCYSQKGQRAAIQYKKSNYLKNIKDFKIIDTVRRFIFSKENISRFYKTLEENDGRFKYSLDTLLNNLNINKSEKGLNNDLFEKFLLKFIRNPLYKSKKLKQISRKLRMFIYGPKFHITFSISKTNFSYKENPHIDQQNKVLVGLLYLDNNGEISNSNLTFWKSNNNKKLNMDKNLYVINTPLEKIKNISQKRNRLVIFVNNEKAIHSAIGNSETNRRFIYFSIVSANDF